MKIFDFSASLEPLTAFVKNALAIAEPEAGDRDAAASSAAFFNSLTADMHAHWLPGVDDGAANTEQGLEMVGGLCDLGFSKLIATPHIMADRYPNRPDELQEIFEEFQWAVRGAGLEVSLHLAAEYMLDEGFEEHLESDALLTLDGTHLLVEMPLMHPFPRLHEVLFQLKTRGIQPILAHPERYLYYRSDFSGLLALKEKGCLFQLDLLALTGQYGTVVKKQANKLLRRGAYEWAGTDVHHPRQVERLKQHTWTIQQAWLNPGL
jgi:tyrosine-protein phosphatase YwqE